MERCVATSLEGFVQQLTVAGIGHGYVFFVMGRVPPGKDATVVDEKLVRTYGIDISKWARARRKAEGRANLLYIRFESTWVILATPGEHESFFRLEHANVRDARRTPIRVGGYAISHRGGHASVRIDQRRYQELKAYLVDLAKHRRRDTVEAAFRQVPFVPYAPIRRQLLNIFREANRVRRAAGFAQLSKWCLRLERRNVPVFQAAEQTSGVIRDRCHAGCDARSEASQSGRTSQSESRVGRDAAPPAAMAAETACQCVAAVPGEHQRTLGRDLPQAPPQTPLRR